MGLVEDSHVGTQSQPASFPALQVLVVDNLVERRILVAVLLPRPVWQDLVEDILGEKRSPEEGLLVHLLQDLVEDNPEEMQSWQASLQAELKLKQLPWQHLPSLLKLYP